MSELPRKAVTRTARLAALPLGYAGRTAVGVGRRLGGAPAETVLTEMQQRTAEQLFRTLGELKGGAMKFGQALSIFEAALPEELAGPYREHLTKLQDSAPPMSVTTVRVVLSRELGADWREKLVELDPQPAASASLGQVHRGRWHDGRDVAIKIQYPGAEQAFASDLRQLARVVRPFGSLVPGIDLKPIIQELQDRAAEELDYRLEAEAQAGFAAAYAQDPEHVVPAVVAHTQRALVSEWMDSTGSLAQLIKDGTQEQRDHYGTLYARFLLAGPGRTGMLHADPHPGNFRLLPVPEGTEGALGGMGVVDYGAVARLPERGFPPAMGRLARAAARDDYEGVLAGLREEGFIKPRIRVEAAELRDFIAPLLEPASTETFRFSRKWMRIQFERLSDPRRPEYSLNLKVNLPPSYLLIHRTWLGAVGVLSQLEAEVPFRALLEEHLPGFAD